MKRTEGLVWDALWLETTQKFWLIHSYSQRHLPVSSYSSYSMHGKNNTLKFPHSYGYTKRFHRIMFSYRERSLKHEHSDIIYFYIFSKTKPRVQRFFSTAMPQKNHFWVPKESFGEQFSKESFPTFCGMERFHECKCSLWKHRCQ